MILPTLLGVILALCVIYNMWIFSTRTPKKSIVSDFGPVHVSILVFTWGFALGTVVSVIRIF